MDQDITLEMPREALTEVLLTLRRVPGLQVQVKNDQPEGPPSGAGGGRGMPSMAATAAGVVALAVTFIPTADAIAGLATKLYDLWKKISPRTSPPFAIPPGIRIGSLIVIVSDCQDPDALAKAITAALGANQADEAS